MATLEIKKAKTTTKDGKWFTFEVDNIVMYKGKIYLLAVNKKYQFQKILIDDCIIVK